MAFVSLFSQVVTQASPATLRGRQEILEPLQVVSIISWSLVRPKSTVEMLLSSRGMTVCGQSRVSHHCISAHVPPIKCFVQIIADVHWSEPGEKYDNAATVVHSSLLLPPRLRIQIHWKMSDLWYWYWYRPMVDTSLLAAVFSNGALFVG